MNQEIIIPTPLVQSELEKALADNQQEKRDILQVKGLAAIVKHQAEKGGKQNNGSNAGPYFKKEQWLTLAQRCKDMADEYLSVVPELQKMMIDFIDQVTKIKEEKQELL